jgi:hypothetical protein
MEILKISIILKSGLAAHLIQKQRANFADTDGDGGTFWASILDQVSR